MSSNAFDLLSKTPVSKKTAKKNEVAVPYKQKAEQIGDEIVKKPPVFPAKRISKKDDMEKNTTKIVQHNFLNKDHAANSFNISNMAMQIGYKTIDEKTNLTYFTFESALPLSEATGKIALQAQKCLKELGVCVRCLKGCVNVRYDGKFTPYCKECSALFWFMDKDTQTRKKIDKIDGPKNFAIMQSMVSKKMKMDDEEGGIADHNPAKTQYCSADIEQLNIFTRDTAYGPTSKILPSQRLARAMSFKESIIGRQFIDPAYYLEKDSAKREAVKQKAMKDTHEWLLVIKDIIERNPQEDIFRVMD